MQKITPCLLFDGKAGEAMKFYQSIFKDTKIESVHKRGGKFLVGFFRLNGTRFMVLNGPKCKGSIATSFSISCRTQVEVDHYWNKLAQGGRESCCGWLEDKYGFSWQIVPEAMGELMNKPDKKGTERVFQAMLKMTKIDIATLKRAYNQK